MISVRQANQRGHADHGWLRSHHTFSFADYFDPDHMGVSVLRVINDDRIAPGAGFPPHGHRDMEIVSYVLEGGLEHQDSLGNGSVIRPGDVQRMTAGTGVTHSEYNASATEPVHFLQIWILPRERGLQPEYEQRHFPQTGSGAGLRLLASPDGADGSLTIHQEARIYAALLDDGEEARLELPGGRMAWLHLARGSLQLNGVALREGDGAAVADESGILLRGGTGCEALLFDLPGG